MKNEDLADHETGLEIIRVLNLRRKRDNGRVDTTHGDKNPCGLTRTLRHLCDPAAPELLAACEAALAYIIATNPEEHGNPELGRVWGTLETAISKATA